MKRAIVYAASGLSACALFLACSANVGADRGGLVLGISTDGTLQLDRLKVKVSNGDSVLLQNEFAIPETALPNTLSIVSNGSSTATATIVVTGWLAGVPVDRRDAIVTQIPSDRLVSFGIVLSARCTPFVKLGTDPTTADSTCGDGRTCDPTVAQCVSANVDASGLPDYVPGALPDAANGETAPPLTNTSDSGPGPGPGPGPDAGPPCDPAACAVKLAAITTTPADCAEAYCDTATNACAFRAHDADGDGARAVSCSAPGVTILTGNDCDDGDKNVFAGKTAQCSELPNGTAVTFPSGVPVGQCTYGTKLCQADGKFAACAGVTAPATVNCSVALDNDCDGQVDNAECGCILNSTAACYSGAAGTQGVGGCTGGTKTCMLDSSGTKTAYGPCVGEVVPAAHDTCVTGNDNNCNGVANDGCVCHNAQTSSCGTALGAKGTCATGTTTCSGTAWPGFWNGCSIGAATHDTCVSGNDNSCNGAANEACTCIGGVTGTCGAKLGKVGTCAGGTTTCNGGTWPGAWGGCSIAPAAHDTCVSGNDDSCNGAANEACGCLNGQTATCGAALGAVGTCAGGSTTCNGTGWPGSWGGCSIAPAAHDTCTSGNNDSCSGGANEGCTCIAGKTACGTAGAGCTMTCSSAWPGAEGACTCPPPTCHPPGTPCSSGATCCSGACPRINNVFQCG